MRLYTTTLRQWVSSRKFYEIVKEKQERIIPKTAEEAIISKYLKDNPTYMSNAMQEQAKKTQKAQGKTIAYQHFLRQNPNGCIVQMDYKDTRLQMVSLNYQNISLRDVYQLCDKKNPDLVLVQSRPQAYLRHFQLLPKVNDSFSDLKYLQQLIVSPRSIKSSILSAQLSQKLQAMVGVSSRGGAKKVFINDNKDLVDDDVLMMAAYYCSSRRKGLLLAELPQQPWRQWVCNSHTLMELQQLFKHICKNIPFYESLQLSPYRLAALLRPEIFLNVRDRYMATVIEMAIATQKYKSILCFMGVAQNQAVQQVLEKGLLLRGQKEGVEFTPVIEYLVGPQIKHSILRNVEGWQIIQKHIIMDVLHYGEGVLHQSLQTFATTNKVIEQYGRIKNDYPQQVILQFRYDKTMQYVALMKQQMSEGSQLRRKFMLRQALRVRSDDV